MPGYNNSSLPNPGRSAPVRGVASQQASTSSSSTSSSTVPSSGGAAATAMSAMPRLPSNHRSNDASSSSNHPMGWDRPYSSGVPAPAVAVPIFRAAHAVDGSASLHSGHRRANTAQLPDSPPDTPPHSPGLHPVRLPTLLEPQSPSQMQRLSPSRRSDFGEQLPYSGSRPLPAQARSADVSADAIYTGQTPCDSEMDSDAESDFSDDASQATLDQLTQAAQSLLLHSEANRAKAQEQANDSSIPAHRNARSVELMPATPEISPDNDVRHHAQKSAHTFLHRIFANVPRDLAVEDAGMELISRGWSGAVIKSGAASPVQASTSLNSTSSSDSSADTQRTLYVSMPPVVDATLLREQVLAVLDAASEKLGCDVVMVCLNKAMRDFASVLHGLCYVGGALVAAAKQSEQLGVGPTNLPDTDPISGLQLKSDLVLVAIEL